MSSGFPSPNPPSRAMLAPAEQLLFCSLRAWLAAREAGEGCTRVVAQSLGWRTSPRAGALFAAWAQAIDASRRRPLHAECPRCGGLSPDLQRLVVACGLAPVDLEVGATLLEPLVTETECAMVLARSLNAALAEAGWPLPARIGSEGVASAGPPRQLH